MADSEMDEMYEQRDRVLELVNRALNAQYDNPVLAVEVLTEELGRANRALDRWCEWQDQVLDVGGAELLDRLTGLEPAAPPCRHERVVAELRKRAAEWDRKDTERADALGALECSALEERAARDRARDIAVALEQEAAELRRALERLRTGSDPTPEEISADEALDPQPCMVCFAGGIAEVALARTDPARGALEAGRA